MKKLLFLLLFVAPAFGQGAFYSLPSPMPGAVVGVCPVPPGTNPCASPVAIFSNQALSQAIANPFSVGPTGNFGFWVSPGQYTIQIAAPYNQTYTVSIGGGSSGPITAALTPESFGAVGNGVTNDCAAFTTASASDTDVWLTAGHNYAIAGSCAVTAQVNLVNNSQFIVTPGATLTLNQPPNTGGAAIQVFTQQTTTSVADTMQRANENPMSDGGAWVVGSYAGTGLTAEAGQLASNLYEQATANATITGYVLWNASGAFGTNQISTIGVNTSSTATTCAVIRGSTSNAGQYRACVISGFPGATAGVQLSKVASGGAVTNFVTCTLPLYSGDKLGVGGTGTSTTVLQVYANGAPVSGCNGSDSTSPITSGLPGMVAFGSGTIANSKISSWSGATLDTGVVQFNGNTTSVLPEWFGAKGDGSTDDSVAIQNAINSLTPSGGEVFFAPKTYKTTQTLSITHNFVTLRGAPVGAFAPIIKMSTATPDVVLIQGASGALLAYNAVQDLSLARAVAPSGSAKALNLNFVQWTRIDRVNYFDHMFARYQQGPSANTFAENEIVFNSLTASSEVGFAYTGAANSSRITDSIAICTAGVATGQVMTVSTANGLADLFAEGVEGAACNGMSTTGNIFDLHVIRPVFDQIPTGGFGISVAAGSNAENSWMEFVDAYIFAVANSTAILVDVEGTPGFRMIGGVLEVGGGAGSIGIKLNAANTTRALIQGVHLRAVAGTNVATGIQCSGGATDDTIVDNSIYGTAATPFGTMLNLTGCTNSVVTGNNLNGTASVGISADATSTPGVIANNNVDTTAITTPYSGAGIIPTISAGFGTSPSVVAGSQGPQAFTINVGGGGAASTGTIGMPTARHGWVLNSCTDVTTQSTTVFMCKQTGAGTTTTLPIGNFNTAGSAAAWVANDILTVSATPY